MARNDSSARSASHVCVPNSGGEYCCVCGRTIRTVEKNKAKTPREWWLACDGLDRWYSAFNSYEEAKGGRVMEPIHVREVIDAQKALK